MTATKKIKQADRGALKAAGLSLVQYRILTALAGAGKGGLSYRGIEAKTGYYSVLTANLRARSTNKGQETDHGASLGAKGLVRESVQETPGGRTLLVFVITAKGRKALAGVGGGEGWVCPRCEDDVPPGKTRCPSCGFRRKARAATPGAAG
jgi:hypothetical protein